MGTQGKLKDISGKVFGKLTAVKLVTRYPQKTKWLFRCACGSETMRTPSNVYRHKENAACTSCGSKAKNIKHNMSYSSTYRSWAQAKKRCTDQNDPAYSNYGGRGISFDKEWMSFENFLADMGEKTPGAQIDRIDNNLGYTKSNCRWASRIEQCNNRRSSKFLEYSGEKRTLAGWARFLKIDYKNMWYRMKKGETLGDIVGNGN